jgi:hypothetical protein
MHCQLGIYVYVCVYVRISYIYIYNINARKYLLLSEVLRMYGHPSILAVRQFFLGTCSTLALPPLASCCRQSPTSARPVSYPSVAAKVVPEPCLRSVSLGKHNAHDTQV